jgi:hypothetical protein
VCVWGHSSDKRGPIVVKKERGGKGNGRMLRLLIGGGAERKRQRSAT